MLAALRAPLVALLFVACAPAPAPAPTPAPAAPASRPDDAPKYPPAQPAATTDVFETGAGPLTLHPVQHATLWFEVGGKVVWVDPWSKAELDGPKADIVLITDIHADHFDEAGLAAVRGPEAVIVAPKVVAEKLPGAVALANGERKQIGSITVEAVPMYNLQRGPEPGKLYHDKGRGNGYVVTVGETRLYLSGDTECTPEMKALTDIDVALVCMNLPYTMTPDEAAQCVSTFKPKVLYPYHYRDSNLDELERALTGSGVEVRRRAWY